MTKREATEARLAKIVRLGTRTQAINASKRLAAMRRETVERDELTDTEQSESDQPEEQGYVTRADQ